MKIYLARYPEKEMGKIDESLNYIAPELQKKLSLKALPLKKFNLQKNDLILFYHTFSQADGAIQDVIFAYYQVNRVENGMLFPNTNLSFDKSRCGYAPLGYSRKRVLTRYGSEVFRWSLPEFLRCTLLTYGEKNLASAFRQQNGLRFFENRTDAVCITPIPSRDSAEYYENALGEWASSICEDIRGEATRAFNTAKKGSVGMGKTGFVKYIYAPDMRKKFYCRSSHIVDKRNERLCNSCPMYKKKNGKHCCEWSLPLYNALPYIPLTTHDAFAYFDVLLEKGLVMDYRD